LSSRSIRVSRELSRPWCGPGRPRKMTSWWNEVASLASIQVMSPRELASLVDTHAPPLILYARQWCAAPEDVVQDAFVKLVALRQPPRAAVPWLYRVVRNGAIDAGKTARRRQRREASAARPVRWFVEPEVD